ncbi:hypothetical protein BHE74_00005780 [Ensete ventricosum]|nr:hypothetical protein BHE74_00005780 [Ensete ventricosum]
MPRTRSARGRRVSEGAMQRQRRGGRAGLSRHPNVQSVGTCFDAPLDIDLTPLTHGRVWLDGEALVRYIRGTLIPRLASDLYTLPSEVLMDEAAKAMVLAQSLAEHLRVELDEVSRCRWSVEVELEEAREELAHLRRHLADSQGELAEFCGQLNDSKSQLWNTRTQVREMETELLELTRSKDALRVDLPKRAIEDYKKSPGFEMGLIRMGRVSLEYSYQPMLARLRARHPGVEIE